MENELIKANLLWTGGMDSTFQLLRLLLLQKVRVQPYYIIDPNRDSTLSEINAIKNIKHSLLEAYPLTNQLLLPIKFGFVPDIGKDQTINLAYSSIKVKKHIGTQYEWLACYCKEKNIFDMQLSVEKSIVPDPNLWDYNLQDMIRIKSEDKPNSYSVDASFKDTDEYQIFKYFTFPLIQITKSDMLNISKDNNWNHILEQTWFCLHPTRNNQPCGMCNPCIMAMTEGFEWRIPKKRRLISKFYRTLGSPLKKKLLYILSKTGFE